MRTVTKTWTAVLAAGLLGIGALAGPAIAQDGEGDDTTTTEDRPTREERREQYHASLAAELGITVEELEAAIDAVRADLFEQRLQDAIDDGRLTEEEADQLRQAYEDGDLDAVRDAIRLSHLEDRLAAAVEAGDLTQEEADEILERAEEGDFPGRRGHHGRHGPGGPGGPGLFGPGDVDDAGFGGFGPGRVTDA